MSFRGRVRRLEREARRDMIVVELEDGSEALFYGDAVLEALVAMFDTIRAQGIGEERPPTHPLTEALRHATNLEELVSEHGECLHTFIGEDRIARGERQRTGAPVVESSPGCFE